MIGRPVRWGRDVAEARSLSLCTLGRSFMYGNWNLVKADVVRRYILVRPSDRVRLKNANYAIFSGQIVRLERPIMR